MALRGAWRRRPVLRPALSAARRGWQAYAFVLPGVLAIFAFAIYPSLYQFYLAAHRGDGLGAMQYVGWDNFARIFDVGSRNFDRVFWTTVVPNTLLYMTVVTVGQLGLGLLLASMLNAPLKANRFDRALFFIPLVTSLAVVSVILTGLLKGEDSGLNQLLASVGLRDLPYWLGLVSAPGQPVNWLGEKAGLGTIMAVGTWHGLPYNIILLLAALQSIAPELYEAARVDGANAWRQFIHITIPELAPILIVIAFQSFIASARAFSLVFVLTEGGINHSSELVATYIYKWGFVKPWGREPDLGYASALGIAYSLMLAALTLVNVIIVARRWKRRLEAGQGGEKGVGA
jgi:ABC-type sugar transport system permease subunit